MLAVVLSLSMAPKALMGGRAADGGSIGDPGAPAGQHRMVEQPACARASSVATVASSETRPMARVFLRG